MILETFFSHAQSLQIILMKTSLTTSGGSHNNLMRGNSNEKTVVVNRSSLGNPQMSKTQTLKSTKTAGFGNLPANTASALAMMLAGGGSGLETGDDALKRSMAAVTPDKKSSLNSMIHTRNLSSQQSTTWVIQKPKQTITSLGQSSVSARQNYINLKPTSSISPLRPQNTSKIGASHQYLHQHSQPILDHKQKSSPIPQATLIDLSQKDPTPRPLATQHQNLLADVEDACASQTSMSHRDRIRRLKTENTKLLSLLTETEEKFKSRIDQTRKESHTIMNLIAQILPYVKRTLRQNQNDQEAKELIRQIEMNAFTTSTSNEERALMSPPSNTYSDNSKQHQQAQQQDQNTQIKLKMMKEKIERLEDEIFELKENHQRELMNIQQEFTQERVKYEGAIISLRKEVKELRAFKQSVDLHVRSSNEAASTPGFLKALAIDVSICNNIQSQTTTCFKASQINFQGGVKKVPSISLYQAKVLQ